MAAETFLFTSESVGEGHPGKYWELKNKMKNYFVFQKENKNKMNNSFFYIGIKIIKKYKIISIYILL